MQDFLSKTGTKSVSFLFPFEDCSQYCEELGERIMESSKTMCSVFLKCQNLNFWRTCS